MTVTTRFLGVGVFFVWESADLLTWISVKKNDEGSQFERERCFRGEESVLIEEYTVCFDE